MSIVHASRGTGTRPPAFVPIQPGQAPSIIIRVGRYHCFPVFITIGQLFNSKGEELVGETRWTEHVILISGAIPPGRRLDVLKHEAQEAWAMITGIPEDRDRAFDWHAFVLEEIQEDFERGGGHENLLTMKPTFDASNAFDRVMKGGAL